MPIDPAEGDGSTGWRGGLAAASRTFGIVMGGAGPGLLGGLSSGAWAAYRPAPGDELLTAAAWAISLVLFGAAGFAIGLAAGLLSVIMTWILRLARALTKNVG